jgi:hypothetical protein
MQHVIDTRTLFAVVGTLALAACAPDAASRAATPASGVQSYLYDGPAGSSRVTQALGADGLESLHGSTHLAGRAPLNEVATVDAAGRLRRAEIAVARQDGASLRYTLEPSRAIVRIEQGDAAPIEWHVPADAPWLYAPAADEGAELSVTPVSAWIALRATRAADVVRVLEPEQQVSHLVMIDQLAVPTERGTTIALGHGVDADDRFITELRLREGDASLSRVMGLDPGA